MKTLFFLLLSTFGLLSNASTFGCQSVNMNELCLSKVVENCYNCEHLIPQKSLLEPVCVPLFHNNLGVLENYPSDKWNCTLYRPQIEETNNEFMTEIGEVENESKLIDDVCQIDNFISSICGHEDKNGFCMIANYIDDICHLDEEKDEDEKSFDLKQVSLQKYVSPWGPSSDCVESFYQELCSNKLVKFCFDCRKLIGKELFTQKPRYSYTCSPFYKDMNEKETVDWFSKNNYECKRWNNLNYKPSSFLVQNYETEDNLNENVEESFDLKQVSLQKYVSPWGPQSECLKPSYTALCTDKLVKFCFDCRKFLGKESKTQKSHYSYFCDPFYNDDNEKENVDWFNKNKYECKRWYNPNFKSSSFSIQNYETEGKLYSACTGPICRKEGWFYRGDHFGKEWCGMGKCKEYFGNRVLCDFPTNCGKKMNSIEIETNFKTQFQTLGCGKEKFKCLLNKDCRQLVKRIDGCDKDLTCLFNLLIDPTVYQNKIFFNLVQCMIPSH
jgi:hypothetical protein